MDNNVKEKKNIVKKTQKKPANPRKNIKKAKGQKDIRALIKLKKNELYSYTNDFNIVCKQSGIDVDSEQLQLAIALSKSLHPKSEVNVEPESEIENSRNISSKERQNRIHSTLKEYGFKIVGKQKTAKPNYKKYKKHYKLLLITEAEREQIIADKYAQVLLKENIDSCPRSHQVDNSSANLYNLTTNALYEDIRNINVFYLTHLVEKSNERTIFLKNWADIPGRPVSPEPKLEHSKIHFADILCSQDELDTILSGTIKSAQEIFKSKCNLVTDSGISESNNSLNRNLDVISNLDKDALLDKPGEVIGKLEESDQENNNCNMECSNRTQLPTQRSMSPDIFDDEVSLITEDSGVPSKEAVGITLKNNHDFMDLTQCANAVEPPLSQLSQNCTKRKSNDFMEITDCVTASSQRSLPKDKIDLTQHSDEDNIIEIDNNDAMDLTQSSDTDIDLPYVQVSGSNYLNSSDDTVILNYNDIPDNDSNEKHDVTTVSLHSSPEASEILTKRPTENIDLQTCSNNVSSGDSIALDNSPDSETEVSLDNQPNKSNFDLTQSSDTSSNPVANYSIGDSPKKQNNLGKINDVSIDYDDVMENEIDTSNKSFYNTSKKEKDMSKSSVTSAANSEAFELSDKELNYSIQQCNYDNVDFGGISLVDGQSSFITHKRHSVLSLNKSMSESFLPEVAVKSENNQNKGALNKISRISSFDNLVLSSKPNVNTVHCTPKKKVHKSTVGVQNLDSDEYIIKTEQVSPLLNYESMTTPERNTELKKYGLKPFKRKRAIQLLTHIYNQTHPIVELSANEELPTPSKKQKTDFNLQYTPRKDVEIRKSPKKQSKTLNKVQESTKAVEVFEVDKENDLYMETKEVPDIKHLECKIEDWVFQNREKAKLHTCRVPLHLAFHNYVSCRRKLREAILRYEPVNIEVIHKGLVATGYRYNPKDLLKFLDKKCITVKTADNNGRNNKKQY